MHWHSLIPELQFVLNSTYASALGLAPYLLMFGSAPRPLVPSLAQPPGPATTEPSLANLQQYATRV